MSKASSVVASVTQQSGQRVPQSRTEYRKRPKATYMSSAVRTTARQADNQQRSVDDVSVPPRRPERNRQLDTYRRGTDETAMSQDNDFILSVYKNNVIHYCGQ